MTLNVFDFFKDNPKYNKLIGNDYMFVEYKCPIDVEQFKLWTDIPFITYVISGKKDWTSVNKTYPLHSGDALFLRKGVYNTKQYFEEDYCTIVFFITEDFIRKFISSNENLIKKPSISNENSQVFPIDVTDSLNTLFLSVFNYFNMGGDIPKELVEIKFNELLFNIALNPLNKDLVTYFHSLKNIDKANMYEVMIKHFHNDLQLDEFARLSGRSLSSFKRDFKALFNETPGKWLAEKRLEYAKTLLQNPKLNINDICYESGFKNTSHFNKSFKQKYGAPPYQFRKSMN
ncbi:helix-turn-helix transcriptional regulator [Tamlana fucoidanivorans]|uniref:Helix-turn-helix transcriptional regulator n=1 Tax=Allotamlana fucoidanivorans TaxID=2583814 RepID=A0A5C4SH00_9FLAO|nr:AraC family transcriptional regulator [Tamlana fucoidanivorans]TNJ42927.1 helix-turn-helix transcriptional regulator [Tamlana fucoidanivorans]